MPRLLTHEQLENIRDAYTEGSHEVCMSNAVFRDVMWTAIDATLRLRLIEAKEPTLRPDEDEFDPTP